MIFLRDLTTRCAPWVPLLVFAGVVGIAMVGLVGSKDQTLFVGQERMAPELVMPGLYGGSISIHDPADTYPLLVNFWASWCTPCLIEHPILMHMAAQGVPIVGVAYKDSPDNARGYLKHAGDPYMRIGLDTSGDAGLALGISGVPETFVIDIHGKIVFAHRGPLNRQSLARLDALLAKTTNAPLSDSPP